MVAFLILFMALFCLFNDFFITCQTFDDHPTEEFDWKALLADSPPQTPDGKRSSTSPKNNSLAENVINTPYVRNNFHHDSAQASNMKPENHSSKTIRRIISKKAKSRARYNISVKERTGFSSTKEARLHHYRTLESNGTATEEQKAALMLHRRKKMIQTRRSTAKKLIERNKKNETP